LRRRNRDVKTAEQRALNRKHKVSTSRNKQDEPIKRVEKYVKEYKQQQKSFVDIKRRVILTFSILFNQYSPELKTHSAFLPMSRSSLSSELEVSKILLLKSKKS